MSTTQHHDADRETLSALFDGELQGSAARFAVKRLDHDVQWRDACGRWQLVGDALRGQATGVAPSEFADRVGAALADEAAVAASTVATTTSAWSSATTTGPRTAMPMRRSWIGGAALAASVAVAALFVARPFSQSSVPSLPPTPVAANAQPVAPMRGAADAIATRSPPPPAAAVQSPTPPVRGRPVVKTDLAATMASADAPRHAGESRSPDPTPSAAADSPQHRIDDSMAAATASTAIASNVDAVPTGMQPSSTHPFLPQDEIISRPWPRAVLPNYPAGSAFTASFDGNAGPGASSFYPFEPRMLDTDPPRDAGPAPSDWPQR